MAPSCFTWSEWHPGTRQRIPTARGLLQVILNVAGRKTLGKHDNDLVFDSRHIRSVLFDDGRLILTGPDIRNLNVNIAVLGTHLFLAIAFPAVGGFLIFRVA
jgi:hypothetical protein